MNFLKSISILALTLSLTACGGPDSSIASTMIGDVIDESGRITSATSLFQPDTEEIFVTAIIADLDSEIKIRGEWWFMPEDFKISVFPLTSDGTENILHFSLTKPDEGWPQGDYEMRIFLDDRTESDSIIPFEIRPLGVAEPDEITELPES